MCIYIIYIIFVCIYITYIYPVIYVYNVYYINIIIYSYAWKEINMDKCPSKVTIVCHVCAWVPHGGGGVHGFHVAGGGAYVSIRVLSSSFACVHLELRVRLCTGLTGPERESSSTLI